MQKQGVFLSSVTGKLTLQNFGSEINHSLDAIARYRLAMLGAQFRDYVGVECRDADREQIVRLITCVTRVEESSVWGKAGWW